MLYEIDCDITLGKVEHALQGCLNRCEISEVRLKIGETEAIYSREQILKDGFKIKPEDFHNVSASRSGGSTLEKGVEPDIVANADAKLAKFLGLNKKPPHEIAIERQSGAGVPSRTWRLPQQLQERLRLAATETNMAYRTSDHLRWQQMDFVGWHLHCRCHVVTVLKTEEEMQQDTQRILAGEQPESSRRKALSTPCATFLRPLRTGWRDTPTE